MTTQILTVGHGNLPSDDFAALLVQARVGLLADVRRYPGSRRFPHFGKAAMERWLAEAGVGHVWEEDLGGRRPVPADSPDVALPDSLRGYAAHMRGPAFGAALGRVLDTGEARVVAVCCAEADWRRCHRRLLADAATLLHGVQVQHLRHDGSTEPHRPSPDARRVDDGLVYDGGGTERRLPGLET